MAEKMTGSRKGATVHQLPPRAAGGAGKSKPRTSKVTLKSTAPAPKSQSERDAEIRDANLQRRMALASKDRKIDVRVEVVREQLKDLLVERKQVRDAIQGTGIPLALYDEAKADALKTRVDLEEKERLRAETRQIFGLPAGVEKGLFDGIPDAAKEEAHWDDMGYRAGRAGREQDPPEGCPKERDQTYRRAWDRAQGEMLAALARTDGTATGMTLSEAAQAGRQPPENPDASHVSTPSGDDDDQVGDDAAEAETQAVVDQVQAEADDEFEASQDELQGQAARRAVQDSRATDQDLEPHGTDAQRDRVAGGIV